MKKNCLLLLIFGVMVSACQPVSTPEAAPNLEAVRTQAVQTAIMEMTVQAVLHPSETPVPAATAPEPISAIVTAQPASDSDSLGGSGGSGGGSGGTSGTPIPTWTPDVYICDYIGQNPLDKPQMSGADYDMVWTIRNTGVVTWNTSEFYIKWLGGTDLSPKHTYPLSRNVAPFDTVDIVVDIHLPSVPSDDLLVTRWGIVNDNGDVFCKFFHAIPSIYPASTKTPTVNP